MLSQPQGHSAAGKIMSMKNSSDTIGNQTRDLPACSAMSQSTLPPLAPKINIRTNKVSITFMQHSIKVFRFHEYLSPVTLNIIKRYVRDAWTTVYF